MEFNRIGLTPIVIFNMVVWLFFTLAYFYQFVYLIRVAARGTVKLPAAKKLHRYAFFISAHNEEPVIGNLVRSILAQDYPRELMDVFVVCDACTDNTHEEAERAGAIVWDRNDLARRGKSWAMALTASSTSMATSTRASLCSTQTISSRPTTSAS